MDREEKLRAYEKMQEAVLSEYERVCSEMNKLKSQGKVKTVTYKTLFAKKLNYQEILSLYSVYGLSAEARCPGGAEKDQLLKEAPTDL